MDPCPAAGPDLPDDAARAEDRAWFQTVAWTISPRFVAKERPELEPTYAGASEELSARNPTNSPTAF